MEPFNSHADYGDIVDKKENVISCLQSIIFKAAFLDARTHRLEPSIRFQSLLSPSLLFSGSALSSLDSFGNSLSAFLESSASRSSASASIF